jgi:predicted amidohydrolase YtcJ
MGSFLGPAHRDIALTIEKADLLLHGGAILGRPDADAVAACDGTIVAIGRSEKLGALVGARTHAIDLAGRIVAPGFIDCHLHFLEAASVFCGIDLSHCSSIEELLAALADVARRTPPRQWIRAFGCDEALIAEKRGPTRDELDRATPRNPMRLRHQTLHASWLNSRAPDALGLDAANHEEHRLKPVPRAHIERDVHGRRTGFVIGMEEWITSQLPPASQIEIETRARKFSLELASRGITAFTDATVRNGPDEASLFARLTSGGAIAQRVSMMLGANHLGAASDATRIAREGGVEVVAAKFMPSSSDRRSELVESVVMAGDLGLDCAFHATELDELAIAVDAFESAKSQGHAHKSRARLRIEHGGLMTSDFIDRLANLGAWVVTNPGFLYWRGRKYADDPGLVPHLYRAKSLIRAGVKLAAGTDAPVTPARPLAAIAAAIARVSRDGVTLAPEERIAPAEAFSVFTSAAADLARLNSGEIATGKLADLVVLPRDPLTTDWRELKDMRVDMTIIDGRIVYDRECAGESRFSETFAAKSPT